MTIFTRKQTLILSISVLFLLLLITFINKQTALTQKSFQEKYPESQDLTKKIIQAYGGISKINNFHSHLWKSSGKLSTVSSVSGAANEFPCTIFSQKDCLRIETTVFGQQHIIAYDGKEAWAQVGNWVSSCSKTTTQRLKDEIVHGLNILSSLTEPSCQIELQANKVINNKPCICLRIKLTNGTNTALYVDPNTYLINRIEYLGFDSEQGIEALQAIDYYDYRAIEGTLVPFGSIHYCNNNKISQTILTKVLPEKNQLINYFNIPPESTYSRLILGPVNIPFEYVGNEIVIKVRVNDSKELKFLVDTGASQTVLDKHIAQLTTPSLVSPFSITSGVKALPVNYTILNKMQLGDLILDDISALVSDLTSFSSALGERPAGLIGTNILKRFLVTIDYQNKKLILEDPKILKTTNKSLIIPTIPVFGSSALVINGSLDNKPNLNFLVDTGASFNNLPSSLASKLSGQKLLEVGQIHGLDGQKISIGTLKFNFLKFGPLIFKNPIFTVHSTPETAFSSQKDSRSIKKGLFTLNSMGILGNPILSQTKLCIDYRNERLLIEQINSKIENDKLFKTLESIDREYLKTNSFEQAKTSYSSLLLEAEKNTQKEIIILCHERLASLFAEKYTESKNIHFHETALEEFQKAQKLASELHNKGLEGFILAQWAMLYLSIPRSNNDLLAAQTLLQRALLKAPSESKTYASLGKAMVKANNLDLADKFINQALLLDPQNWQALWTKYALADLNKKPETMKIVLDQLSYYYPSFPKVIQAQNHFKKAQAQSSFKTETVTAKGAMYKKLK